MRCWETNMATSKKKIAKRWHITIWYFDERTGEIESTDVLCTKPMSEEQARKIAWERTFEEPACWEIKRCSL